MGKVEHATITLMDGLKFSAGSGSGHMLKIDATVENGGSNEGPQPLELLLIGLGGCTAMDVITILRKMHQEVTGYEVLVSGERADGHPKVYTKVHVEHVLRGRDLENRFVQRAIDLSETKYCSAMAMLSQVAEITSSYRILEEGEEEVNH